MGEDAALEKRIELVLDELRQGRAGARLDLGEEGLEVLLHQLIQDGLLGAAALVVEGVRGSCALQRWAHETDDSQILISIQYRDRQSPRARPPLNLRKL
jgi:hypothetical protein